MVNWLDRANPQAGGAEIHLFEIFRRLAERGDEITLVCSGWPDARPRERLEGIDVRRFGGRHSFAAIGRRAIRHTIAEVDPDIVVEDINKLPLYVPMLTRRPTCAIIPHLFGGTAFREASFPVALLVWMAERPLAWVYRTSAFHAISHSTRDDLVRRGVPSDRIRVILPGVDAAWFVPDASVARVPDPTFLYVGRLKRYKGVEVLLRAVPIVRRHFPNVVILIAGDGDDAPRLRRLAGELGVTDAVRFLGFVSEEEKRRLLRTAWAHVFPSAKEGWGISNVEAAGCGTAAVASDSPGLRESVRDGETGFLVRHGDPAALAEALSRIARDPDLRERLGAAGRSFAEELSWDRTADATRAHLVETISKRGEGN